jgi:hypothetical protein
MEPRQQKCQQQRMQAAMDAVHRFVYTIETIPTGSHVENRTMTFGIFVVAAVSLIAICFVAAAIVVRLQRCAERRRAHSTTTILNDDTARLPQYTDEPERDTEKAELAAE